MWTLVALAIICVAGIVVFGMRRRRTTELRNRFGPEYENVVRSEGNVRQAESALEARAQRVEQLHIRKLQPDEAHRFATAWKKVQAQFVDDPGGAVSAADRLVGELMMARGYPVGEFDQRVADLSVDHPDVVMNYRAARDLAIDHKEGRASTEDLRQAMVHYRALFRDLLETDDVEQPSEADRHAVGRSHR
jgi:hypothetical protein